jgi:gliding motility-associated lipoprotein GldH
MGKQSFLGGFVISVLLSACQQVGLFERLVNIEGARWSKAQRPEMRFEIADTAASYRFFVVLRHTNAYPYRNLWFKLGLQMPGDTAMKIQRFDATLASADRWLGQGMNDLYEHRQMLFAQPVKFNRPGAVLCQLQQDMRQNPLSGVLQVGIRLEKIPSQ